MADEERVDFERLCSSLDLLLTDFVTSSTDDTALQRVQQQTRVALQVCEDALHKYTLEHLSLSYNGGKDCLVLLIVYLAALHRYIASLRSSDPSIPFPPSIQTIYIQPSHPFTEVSGFVVASAAQYHLKVYTSAKPMKLAFEEYLSKFPSVKAIFVGTRRTDPHGGTLTHFDMTDRGWPEFMRVHPVIDWQYPDIWAFLRRFEIPYCSLYDNGFTSLGGTDDTFPNPALKIEGSDTYRPAYELEEDDAERLGRQK